MPLYQYRAKNKQDQYLKGSIEASTEKSASDILAERGLAVISLQEQVQKVGILASAMVLFNKVPQKDLTIFTRQLSILISATIPIVQALRVLSDQTSNKNLQKIIAEIADEVEGGTKLSQALARHPQAFDDFFVNMIRSGETSGKLDEILLYLADQREKDYDLISKIKGAMVYPIFIFSGLLVVGFIMMTFVVPKLTSMLTEMGPEAKLPFATRLLIATSNFMALYWWLIILLAVGIAIGLKYYLGTTNGRMIWHRLQLKIPIFGRLFRGIYLVRFSRSFGTLLLGGIPVANALKIAGDIVGNQVYEELIEKTVKEVEEGNPISTVFSKSPDMPVMISQMLSVGEQTGRLDDVLMRIANFYNREVDNMTANLLTLIEPIIMIIMGVAVGVMVAAIILPMYSMTTQMQ